MGECSQTSCQRIPRANYIADFFIASDEHFMFVLSVAGYSAIKTPHSYFGWAPELWNCECPGVLPHSISYYIFAVTQQKFYK